MISVKRSGMMAAVVFLGLASFIPAVHAEPMDISNCSSVTTNVLHATDELNCFAKT